MGLGSARGVSRVSRVSRTGAEVEPGLSWPDQKRRRVTWGNRCASVEIPGGITEETNSGGSDIPGEFYSYQRQAQGKLGQACPLYSR